MTRPSVAHVFVDANIALHFQRADQIDWRKLTNTDEVVLIGAPVLLRELESQKVVNGSSKLRDRAANYISWLHQFVVYPETEVRSGVRWLFLPYEPQIDFSTERLSQVIADDHLIASVLSHSRDARANVFVATADLGLEIKLRARGISVLELSDDLRLRAELDPIARENKALKRQIAQFQARMPKLSALFENGSQQHNLILQEPAPAIVKSLEQVRVDNPYMSRPETVDSSFGRAFDANAEAQRMIGQIGVPIERMRKYDEDLDEYFRDYQNYLDQYASWNEVICLHYELKFIVANDGTAPATNIDLELCFPEITTLVDEEDVPKRPMPPEIPMRPRSFLDPVSFSFVDVTPKLTPIIPHETFTTSSEGVPDIAGNKSSVRISYSNLKHQFEHTSDQLIIRFRSPEAVRAFSIDFHLSADEVPDAVKGRLYVQVER